MGILNTSGEYLINVDPDDLLNENNDWEYLYNTANKLKVDIINFGYLDGHEFNLKCSNFKKILRQHQLFEHAFTFDNRINDYLLWNKLVKRTLMLKAYELFKIKIFSEKWNYREDNKMIFGVLINKYLIGHIYELIYEFNINKNSFSLMKTNFDIKNYLINLLKIYIKDYSIPYELILSFITI